MLTHLSTEYSVELYIMNNEQVYFCVLNSDK